MQKAAQIQSYANVSDENNLYEALTRFTLHLVRSIDGALIKNKDMILARWFEYLQNLLSKVHASDSGFLDDLPTLPIIPKLDNPPSFDEVVKAILSLKDNKAACPDIYAEVIKYGGCAFHRRLQNFIFVFWSTKCLP